MNTAHMIGCLGLAWAAGVAGAAELGRQAVDLKSGQREGGVEVVRGYHGTPSELGPGLEAGLAWNAVSWDVGDASYSDRVWAPELSLFYGVTPTFDIRLTGKYAQAGDTDNGADSDLDLLRLGLGSRAWIDLGSDLMPYAGAAVNYYVLSADPGDSEKGMLGLSAEAGVGYLISDFVALRAGVQAETSVTDGEVAVGGNTQDVSLTAVSLGIGAIVLF